MLLYLIIGLIYWAINSFIRRIEISGDWMLPLVWFLAWPLAFMAWFVILIQEFVKWSKKNKI